MGGGLGGVMPQAVWGSSRAPMPLRPSLLSFPFQDLLRYLIIVSSGMRFAARNSNEILA